MGRILLLLALLGSTVLLAIAGGVGPEDGSRGGSTSASAGGYSTEPPVARSTLPPALPSYGDASVVPSDDDIAAVRRAVKRSLPFIQAEGVAWIELHGCTSCHQVTAMLWSQHAAKDRGFSIDAKELDRRTRWAIDRMEGPEVVDNLDGMEAVLLGRPAHGELRHRLEALAPHIAAGQEADGSWKAQGQLPFQRRSEEETNRVSTVWATLAIASTVPADDDPLTATLSAAKERVVAWREVEGESFEWLAVRLLFEATLGDAALSDDLLAEVLASQNEDGGWAWILGEESDAFATGQALYALGRLHDPTTRTAIDHGRRYLVESQEDNGSWAVRSTLEREEGVTPTGRYWGTGWAVIGLLETLPLETAPS